MRLRLLLPPHLMLALLAVARHGNVVRAAQELHLTPGAVSKQLMEAERRLGAALFDRSHKRLELTPAGQRYAQRLAPLLAELERATLELRAGRSLADDGERPPLHLSMLPSIGQRWLIPRLPAFLGQHPQVDLRFVRFVDGYDFAKPELDCAIRFGQGHWPGALSDYLLGREVVVIAPAALAGQLHVPADVLQHPLLHHANSPQGWRRWGAAQGIEDERLQRGPQMDQVSSQVRAVASGLGLALVSRALVAEELASGEVLAAPFADFDQVSGYYLCYPEAKAGLPALQLLRQWLLQQAATSRFG
jgi:DNA-binding transcriptional LysR family regulator